MPLYKINGCIISVNSRPVVISINKMLVSLVIEVVI